MFRTACTIIILLSSGLAMAIEWDFSSSKVSSLSFKKQLQDGEYDLYPCGSSGSDGYLNHVNKNRYHFCVGTGIEDKLAKLKIRGADTRLCFWRETGYCDEEGICASISLLDDCTAYNH